VEAKDGSMGFDFSGMHMRIEHTLDENRKTVGTFTPKNDHVELVGRFDAEQSLSTGMQKSGWQPVLDNSKKHTESM
jgi:hypothetical protein